jgi:hypothetical protein
MSQLAIPFLTIEMLEQGETQALDVVGHYYPPAAPWALVVKQVLPFIHKVPAERAIVQRALNAINGFTGAKAPV